MADGFALLGNALGGTSEEAYQEGRAMGAKTEEALANARRRVMENDALARGRSTMVALGAPEELADATYTALAAGGKMSDPMDVLLGNQEFNFRKGIGDPNTPFSQANRYAMAVDAKPTDRYQKVGTGYDDRFDDAGILPLPGGVSEGGGSSAQMQLLDRLGYPPVITDPDMAIRAMNDLRDYAKIFDAQGQPMVANTNPRAAGPGGAPPVQPLVPLSTVTSNKGAIAAAGEQGQAVGRNAAGLESTNATIDKFVSDVDQFLSKPGYAGLYGNIQGTDVGKTVMGLADQDVSDARGALETLGGEAFLASIQKMRGFGQLSNQEGIKVQTALTRALDTRISEPDSRAAWEEVKKHMAELKRVAAIEAGQGAGVTPPATPSTPTTPVGKKVIDGKTYVNPTGNPNDWYEDDGT